MKGKIFKIKNMEDELVLPVTTTEAIYMEDGTTKLSDEMKDVLKYEVFDDESIKVKMPNVIEEIDGIKKNISEINDALNDVVNKGTTVEVLERVTKEEIDRQIADGTIANLTIEDDSLTSSKYKDNSIKISKLDNKIAECFVEEFEESKNSYVLVENGWLHYNQNALQSDEKRKVYTYDVEVGERIQCTGYVVGNSALIKGLDSNDNTIFSFPNSNTPNKTLYENYEIVIPTNVCKVKYCNFYEIGISTTTFVDNSFKRIGSLNLNGTKISNVNDEIAELITENTILKQNLIDSQKSNDFAWSEFDKVYVTFTVDDGNPDISDIATLFENKGVPLCLAIPPTRLQLSTNSGETVLEVCNRVVTNGGEILGHHIGGITSDTSKEEIYDKLINTKKIFLKNNINLQGFITIGGNNWETADFEYIIDLLRPYYKYNDNYGRYNDVVQYGQVRKFLVTSKSANREFIDIALSGGDILPTSKTNVLKWVSFATHGESDSITLEIFGDIIDYIQSLGNDKIEIVNFKYIYDKFGSTKLEERIKKIEKSLK